MTLSKHNGIPEYKRVFAQVVIEEWWERRIAVKLDPTYDRCIWARPLE